MKKENKIIAGLAAALLGKTILNNRPEVYTKSTKYSNSLTSRNNKLTQENTHLNVHTKAHVNHNASKGRLTRKKNGWREGCSNKSRSRFGFMVEHN